MPIQTFSKCQSSDVTGAQRISRRSFLASVPAVLTASATKALAANPGRRVASLDWALAETMLALGHAPLAVVAASDWARFVIDPSLPETTVDLGLQQEINFELLAALRPDLVLISPFLEHHASQIERIAETVNLSVFNDGGDPLAQRAAVTRDLGARLDAGVAAERYLLETEAAFEALKARAAALPRLPILPVTFIDARHVRVYAGASMFQNVLTRLELENAWLHPVGFFGFDTIGIERLATAQDVHLVAFDPVPPDVLAQLSRSPLWTELPFVKAGRLSTLPPVLMFGGMPAARRFAELLITTLEREMS